MYNCAILADSVNVHDRKPDLGWPRLTTFEITYPRIVHSELMTYRMFSRNASSSRAVPVRAVIRSVLRDPFIPVYWGRNQAGMQARRELDGWRLWVARQLWLNARFVAVAVAWLLLMLGLHKQIANRLLEPWTWITVVVTASTFDHFFEERCHPDAQPEIARIARMMQHAYSSSTPQRLAPGEWHLPYVRGCDEGSLLDLWRGDYSTLARISAGRCARTSYFRGPSRPTFDDTQDDLRRFDRLAASKPGHWSPMEHAAQAQTGEPRWAANFYGFTSLRYQTETVTISPSSETLPLYYPKELQ